MCCYVILIDFCDLRMLVQASVQSHMRNLLSASPCASLPGKGDCRNTKTRQSNLNSEFKHVPLLPSQVPLVPLDEFQLGLGPGECPT